MSPPLLAMRLRVPLDRFALEVEVDVRARVTGIFGPSGSGKTTWMETIAGLRRGVSGTLRFGGEVWLDSERGIARPPERRGVGYVPQNQRLFPHLDVRGNLRFGAAAAAAAGGLVDEIAEMLELEPLLDRGVAALSGGERQRVALGRALCAAPRLLLLDEPLASLDLGMRHRLLPCLQRIREALDVPMIVVSHEPFELQALCDEVLALDGGSVVARGAPADVFTDPRVFPAIARQGFHNVLAGTHLGIVGSASRVRLGSGPGAVELVTRPVEGAAPDARVTLSIPAGDILVATGRIDGISARNQFPATVTEVRETGGRRFVFARTAGQGDDDEPLVIELTPDAVAELAVAPGRAVHLLVKSSSIALDGVA